MRIAFFKELNNLYLLPSIRLYYERRNRSFLYLYMEFVWIKWTIALILKDAEKYSRGNQ
jgi:hypothetical protein